MGKDVTASPAHNHGQHSILLVPASAPGVTVHRMLSVFGYDDAPHGHGHIMLKNVRVPASNIVLGQGRGFEIVQGRLGPGRLHHAMRTVGAAESALEWMIVRVGDQKKQTFGQPLSSHGVIREWVANSRIEIDAARMTVLNAAIKIDQMGSKAALREIGIAKVCVPRAALKVIDYAIQAWGAAGVCQDTPLPRLWASTRTMRIVDGPDEVHLQQMGRREIERVGEALGEKLRLQLLKSNEVMLSFKGLSSSGNSTKSPAKNKL
jgi:acyl-CoA dehydrogenase